MNIEAMKIVRENLKTGSILSFAEVMIIQQAIDAAMLQGADGTFTNEGTRNYPEDKLGMVDHSGDSNNMVEPVTTANKLPEDWVACSERMPEADGNYWGWWSESKRQGPAWFIKSELQAQFQSSEITHWMPLPAAPQQEVKP